MQYTILNYAIRDSFKRSCIRTEQKLEKQPRVGVAGNVLESYLVARLQNKIVFGRS